MPFLIGTDEAGYGPNLGPLTVCGTLWNVTDKESDLYDLLSDSLTKQTNGKNRLSVCDSKHIYSSSGTIEKLETSVLSFAFTLFGELPKTVGDFLLLLGIEPPSNESSIWSSLAIDLPLAADPNEIVARAESLDRDSRNCGAILTDVSCQAVFPGEFNLLCEKLGNKAELLSFVTLANVRELTRSCNGETRIVCDKHGGRSKYASLLNQYLTDQFVTVQRESREISEYHWSNMQNEFSIQFQSKGESFLPTALSSMFAKYVRELCMVAWNKFWLKQVPGIHPTKGYPVDAKRFKQEIAQQQIALGINDELIWRLK